MSKMKEFKNKFEWKIANPLSFIDRDPIYSDCFPHIPGFNYQWRLRMKIEKMANHYLLSLYLYKHVEGKGQVRVVSTNRVWVQILDSDMNIFKTIPYQPPTNTSATGFQMSIRPKNIDRIETSITIRCIVMETQGAVCPPFMSVKKCKQIAAPVNTVEDTPVCSDKDPPVIIFKDAPVIKGTKTVRQPICCEMARQPPSNQTPSNVYKEMCANVPTDAIIISKDRVHPCHKAVLSSTSTVLKLQFDNGWVQKPKVLDLSLDFDGNAINDFLLYIYTNEAPNLATTAGQVIKLARLYEINDLVRKCVEKLAKCKINM